VSGQHHAPAAFTPGKDPVPIVQEAGWAPEPVWIGAENLVPPGFDPPTLQPVASRYTDYAIPAPLLTMYLYWLFLQKCNFSQAQCKLPEDSPCGPKHVGANIRYFNVNFNILYV
jgi:hypothetical protein